MNDDVLFERRGALALITLNRPRALNALSHGMVLAIDEQLAAWATDRAVERVLIRGAGERAFCAGGDIRAFYDRRHGGALELAAAFYRDEYRLNRRIFRYPKPYIALADGVTMGGGVGVSVHGSHRVATERTLFAMPETGIGFFPDVGGGYFLPRLPGQVGMYLALTGARLEAADCLMAGIATHAAAAADVAALTDALIADGDVDAVLARFARDAGPAPLQPHRAVIDRCFAGDRVEATLSALDGGGEDWARETAATIRRMSPTSVKVTWRQIRAGAGLSFEDEIKMEYRLSQRFNQGHDFFEGIRAAVVDKDRAPRWQPADLAAVTAADVAAYFAPLAQELTFDQAAL